MLKKSPDGATILKLLLGVLALGVGLYQAEHRAFWRDEIHEFTETLRYGFFEILWNGAAGQWSRQPLYYLVQKIAVLLYPPGSWGPEILVVLRSVSILAGIGTLVLLVRLLFFPSERSHRAWIAGALGVGAVLFHPLFVRFIAESRPYSLWLFFFTLHLSASVAFSLTRRGTPLYLFSTWGLSWVSAAGAVQSIATAFALAFLVHLNEGLEKPVRRHKRSAIVGSATIGVISLLLYWTAPERSESFTHDDVRGVVAVLASLRTISDQAMVILTMVGGGYALLRIRDAFVRRRFSTETALSFLVVSQLACAVLIFAAVAYRQQFINQRSFIQLVVLKACLIGFGARSLLRFKLAPGILGVLALLFSVQQFLRNELSHLGPKHNPGACPPALKEELHLVHSFRFPQFYEDASLNFLVAMHTCYQREPNKTPGKDLFVGEGWEEGQLLYHRVPPVIEADQNGKGSSVGYFRIFDEPFIIFPRGAKKPEPIPTTRGPS